jgi:hypothetical protein
MRAPRSLNGLAIILLVAGFATGCNGGGTSASPDGSFGDAQASDGDAGDGDAGDGDAGDGGETTAWNQGVRFGALDSMTQPCGVAAAPDGAVYVVGQTNGALWGQPKRGMRDLFVVRLRPDATVQWIQQIGDRGIGLGIYTGGCALSVGPGGEVYVAGTANGRGRFEGSDLPSTFTAFAARFEAEGSRRWLRLLGNASGPSEAMAVEWHAGQVRVLGWSSGSVGDQPTRGQGDLFLTVLAADDGTPGRTRRFGTEVEDSPMGMHRDGSGLWIGLKRSEAPLGVPLGYQLLHLSDEGPPDLQFTADAEAGFDVADFGVLNDDAIVVVGEEQHAQSRFSFAFRVYQRDGSHATLQGTLPEEGMRVQAFACGVSGCGVSGRVIRRGSTSESAAVDGFVQLFTPQLVHRAALRLVAEGPSTFAVTSALAPAGGEWYMAGWNDGPLLGQPPAGFIDGYVLRTPLRASP